MHLNKKSHMNELELAKKAIKNSKGKTLLAESIYAKYPYRTVRRVL